MKVRSALATVLAQRDLTRDEMRGAMEEILAGDAEVGAIAGLAVALRCKGETVDEITSAAMVLRERCAAVGLTGTILDTCGTGGDGTSTINISTGAAIAVAACRGRSSAIPRDVVVAKHGNRSVSSRCGSADVLEALGITLAPTEEVIHRCAREAGITFLFAPGHHAALRHAKEARRQLGARTIFNLLGPLVNPAGATHQLIGIYDPSRLRQYAEVLRELGGDAAWVVHGDAEGQGVDEVSPCGETQVAMLRDGTIEARTITPEDFGLPRVTLASLRGGDAEENARRLRDVLVGDERGGARVAIVLNAAAALAVLGAEPKAAAALVSEAIDSGAVQETLTQWVAIARDES